MFLAAGQVPGKQIIKTAMKIQWPFLKIIQICQIRKIKSAAEIKAWLTGESGAISLS